MDLRRVVGREEVEILRERALMFLAAARDDLRAGRVDLRRFTPSRRVSWRLNTCWRLGRGTTRIRIL